VANQFGTCLVLEFRTVQSKTHVASQFSLREKPYPGFDIADPNVDYEISPLASAHDALNTGQRRHYVLDERLLQRHIVVDVSVVSSVAPFARHRNSLGTREKQKHRINCKS
jgi:hypothetical protein